MKITKRGKLAAERIWVGICHECKSEAEATEDELTNISHHQGENTVSWERCPVCNGDGGSWHNPRGMMFIPKNSNPPSIP
jgi:hypothetical protein